MKAYHSSVDTADLYENAPKLPFFLSLVVNYSCKPFAEIAIAGEETIITRTKWKLKNWASGKASNVKREVSQSTYIIPCDVTYEQSGWFITQLNSIKNRPKPIVAKTYTENEYIPKKYSNPFNKRLESGPTYTRGLNYFTELITLGTADNKDMTPATALDKVNLHLGVDQIKEYKKAFKQYFTAEWFDYVYGVIDTTTEIEALEAIEQFINFHERVWVTKTIKDALNELKEEYKQLRTV